MELQYYLIGYSVGAFLTILLIIRNLRANRHVEKIDGLKIIGTAAIWPLVIAAALIETCILYNR